MTDEDLPALWRIADGASARGQSSYVGLTLATLALGVSAAFLSVAMSLAGLSALFVYVLAAMVAALIIRIRLRLGRPDRAWFEGRAIAESTKSAAWRYAMAARPFDGPASDAAFVDRLKEITQTRPLPAEGAPADALEITPAMRALRTLPWAQRRDAYIERRVTDQVSWYSRRSAGARRASARIAWTAGTTEILAVVAAVAVALAGPLPNLIGPLTASTAALTAWSQLRRYDEVAPSYDLAAAELRRARERVLAATNEGTFVTEVEAAEDAISREHTMWAVKRGA